MGDLVASLTAVTKSYRMDDVTVPVLQGIEVEIRPAYFTVLLGPSGSGKTTLLNLIGCLDRPDAGKVVVAGTDVGSLTDDELADFRAENIGFVFQSFNLIPVLTAFENVEYPLVLAGMEPERRRRRVSRLLEAVGLADRAGNRPGQLSGGQRQRVAIARALARKPRLVIADEPTANLDSQTGAAIIGLMRWMQRKFEISFIFSSHDSGLIEAADDLVVMRDGVIQSVRRKPEGGRLGAAAEFEAAAVGEGLSHLPPLPDTDFAFLQEDGRPAP
ncbi:MAG TPA: ABC transporter ATP-binding protein [Rubrivivax sp.]|nr:ABC transporter ATP-binding protein [Rubrivivax sp.]